MRGTETEMNEARLSYENGDKFETRKRERIVISLNEKRTQQVFLRVRTVSQKFHKSSVI